MKKIRENNITKRAVGIVVIISLLLVGVTAIPIARNSIGSEPETAAAKEDAQEFEARKHVVEEKEKEQIGTADKKENTVPSKQNKKDEAKTVHTYETNSTPVSNSSKPPKDSVKQKNPAKEVPNEGKENKPEPTTHVHDWQEVYAERPVYKTRLITQCNNCKEEITGAVDEHNEKYYMNGCGAWSNNVPITEEVGTEKYISGYKCSCGATKQK